MDEQSTKSDEEYDDLAMQDVMENGYSSDDDEELREKLSPAHGAQGTNMGEDKYSKNLDLFLKQSNEQKIEPLCSHASVLVGKNERRVTTPGKAKMRKRSLSIPFGKNDGSIINDPILSGAP